MTNTGHTEDCDPEFGCDEKCTAPIHPDHMAEWACPMCGGPHSYDDPCRVAPISSPRCDAWRPAVDSDPYPATEVRCAFAAGHPSKHSAYQVQW